jgi:hypothetical protein
MPTLLKIVRRKDVIFKGKGIEVGSCDLAHFAQLTIGKNVHFLKCYHKDRVHIFVSQ